MWKELRTISRELLVYMSIADLFSAVALGAGAYNDFHHTTDGCVAQAFFSTFFSTSSMFWMVALLIYLLVTVVTLDPERSARLVLYFHTICWGIPGLVAMLGK
jgi:G protein-coupled receptor 157